MPSFECSGLSTRAVRRLASGWRGVNKAGCVLWTTERSVAAGGGSSWGPNTPHIGPTLACVRARGRNGGGGWRRGLGRNGCVGVFVVQAPMASAIGNLTATQALNRPVPFLLAGQSINALIDRHILSCSGSRPVTTRGKGTRRSKRIASAIRLLVRGLRPARLGVVCGRSDA